MTHPQYTGPLTPSDRAGWGPTQDEHARAERSEASHLITARGFAYLWTARGGVQHVTSLAQWDEAVRIDRQTVRARGRRGN